MAIVIPDPRVEMPELFIPGRKPTGRVLLSQNHKYKESLTAYYVFNNDFARNLVNNKPAINTGPVVPRVKHGNMCHYLGGITDKYYYNIGTDSENIRVAGGAATFIFGLNVTDTSGIRTIISNWPNTILTRMDGGLTYRTITDDTNVTSNAIPGLNQYHTLAIRNNGSTLNHFINGVIDSNSASTIPFSSADSVDYHVGISPHDTSHEWAGDIYFMMAFNRGLSDDQIADLSLNPYQLLVPA